MQCLTKQLKFRYIRPFWQSSVTMKDNVFLDYILQHEDATVTQAGGIVHIKNTEFAMEIDGN